MCAGGFHCTRLSLTFLNILYLAFSITIIAVACWARNVGMIISPPIIGGILASGVFLLFISLLGIVATLRHHQVMLFFYVLILFILFIVQFAVSISCLALSHLQQIQVLKKAWNNAPMTVQEDVMRTLDCCGYDHTEYMNKWVDDETNDKTHGWCVEQNIKIPPSEDPAKLDGYEFCETKIETKTDMAVEKLGGYSLFFSFTEMFGVWLAIRYRNQRNPAGPDPRAFE